MSVALGTWQMWIITFSQIGHYLRLHFGVEWILAIQSGHHGLVLKKQQQKNPELNAVDKISFLLKGGRPFWAT